MKKEGNDKKVTSRRSPRHKLAPRDPKGGRPPQEIAAQLGEHILQVALDQFIAHGVEGANMDDIAAAANVSKRTLYSRYGVDPLWWTGCGLGLLGQAMAPPFIFQG